MKYELLLVNAVRDFGGYSDAFKESIGQYLLASYLRLHDFKAFVYSGNVIKAKQVISNEIEKNKVPVIGFYTAADNFRVVKHLIKWIKASYPFIKTIVGGPQSIALDYDFFVETKNDFAIIGEGEIPILMLMKHLIDNDGTLDEVPSIVYPNWNNNTLIVNHCENAVIND